MRQNCKKFGWDQKVEFKKSFELYRQISFKVLTKAGLNLINFEWTIVSKMKPKGSFMLQKPFFQPAIQIEKIFNEILYQLSQIYNNLFVFCDIKQNFMILNKISLN